MRWRWTALPTALLVCVLLLRRPPDLGLTRRPDLSFDAAELLRRSRSRTLFSPGQSEVASTSVATAVREQPDRQKGALWGNVQTSLEQAEKESDNVRRLLQADGMPSWRPDPAKLPAQRPADASMDRLLEHVPAGGTAWLSFGNSGVTEMLMNWVAHVLERGYGRQMVVAAFDEELLLKLHAFRIPAYNYTGALPAAHFRHAPHLFHRMGFLKAECIRLVLQTGRHVLVSDSDVVWAADPMPLISELMAQGATLASSTDCLDVQADRDKSSRPNSPVMCGHAPGNVQGAVFNTGVLWFKSDASAIDFTRRWAAATLALTDPYSDDQGAFNRLIVDGLYPVKAHSADGRVVLGPKGLRIAPLPAERFCSGHLVWVQQAAQVRECVSVHATFTEYGDAGKRWRFVEAGLWALLPPEYYREGRYLTLEPPKAPPDPMPCRGAEGKYAEGGYKGVGAMGLTPCGGEDPAHGLGPKRFGDIMWTEGMKRSARLRANVELMGRQVHALRDALGIARVLNRTLILPHFECLCDRSEDVEIIPSCVYHGAPPRMQIPFLCSTHFVADTHKLQMLALDPTRFGMQPHKFDGAVAPPIRLRAHSFLTDDRTAYAIRNNVVEVRLAPQGAARRGTDAEPFPDTQVELPHGATDVTLHRLLAPYASTRVLRLADAMGAFGGWEDTSAASREQARLFGVAMDYYVHRGAWCCTARHLGGNQDNGRVYVAQPPPLRMPR